MNIHWTLILLWPFLNVKSVNARKIEWLPTLPGRVFLIENVTSNGIFCHKGSAKTIQTLWWTLQIQIKVISGKVFLYSGGSPEAVFDKYEYSVPADSKFHALSIDPFNNACIAVNFTDNNHNKHNEYRIGVIFINMEQWRVMVMTAGIIVIFSSKLLSRIPAVFYICASVLAIFFLFVPVIYFLHRRPLQDCVTVGVLLTIVYVFFVEIYNKLCLVYVLVAAVIGFLVAYRIGPPEHPRSKEIMMWSFQAVGVVLIRSSSWYEEASWVLSVIALGITYFVPCIKKGKSNRVLEMDVEQQNNKSVARKKS